MLTGAGQVVIAMCCQADGIASVQLGSVFCGVCACFLRCFCLTGNNSLFGTIPENVAGNSQLLVLELHNNPGLYGSFPSMG